MRLSLLPGALLAAALCATPALAARQDFTVVNSSGHVIVTLNVSPSRSNRWGPDILGSEVLANGEEASVSFDNDEDQCLFDIRVTYDDGTANDERGVNLCEVSTVEFSR